MSRITNRRISQIFHEIADILEIQGVNFKPRAYRRAAQAIDTLPEDIESIQNRGELQKIPGVGASLASKIEEILETGKLSYLDKLREELPKGLRELVELEGVGPKTALKLHKKLKISNVGQLESVAREGEIRSLEGFGRKSEENILKSIQQYRRSQKRFLLGQIVPIAEEIENGLRKMSEIERISLAGSIRRRKETIGDVDILVTSQHPLEVMETFTQLPEVKRVLAKGRTKSTIILINNLQVDLRVVESENFGSALQYFTGSKEHNIRLRELALEKNWKLSEYGLKDKNTNENLAGEKEKEIYEALGLDYIEPELRENRGEIEASLEGRVPDLIEYEEVKGDLHVHTKWSDGSFSIEEMARTAQSLGYEYLAICDHSKTLQIAHGLTEKEIREQMREIEQLNRRIEDLTLLCGVEANIDSQGRLDVEEDLLKDLDVVVASVHSGFNQSEKAMTERVLTAMNNDYVKIIGHPTGRIINQRRPYEIDLSRIFETAYDLGVCMEINSFPNRLDLSDVNCFKAKDYGLKFSIATDSHQKEHLRYMKLGVDNARRGWIEKSMVINTLDLKELRGILGD